jgi:hypothetical protein
MARHEGLYYSLHRESAGHQSTLLSRGALQLGCVILQPGKEEALANMVARTESTPYGTTSGIRHLQHPPAPRGHMSGSQSAPPSSGPPHPLRSVGVSARLIALQTNHIHHVCIAVSCCRQRRASTMQNLRLSLMLPLPTFSGRRVNADVASFVVRLSA